MLPNCQTRSLSHRKFRDPGSLHSLTSPSTRAENWWTTAVSTQKPRRQSRRGGKWYVLIFKMWTQVCHWLFATIQALCQLSHILCLRLKQRQTRPYLQNSIQGVHIPANRVLTAKCFTDITLKNLMLRSMNWKCWHSVLPCISNIR